MKISFEIHPDMIPLIYRHTARGKHLALIEAVPDDELAALREESMRGPKEHARVLKELGAKLGKEQSAIADALRYLESGAVEPPDDEMEAEVVADLTARMQDILFCLTHHQAKVMPKNETKRNAPRHEVIDRCARVRGMIRQGKKHLDLNVKASK